jgi:hypothetical protein
MCRCLGLQFWEVVVGEGEGEGKEDKFAGPPADCSIAGGYARTAPAAAILMHMKGERESDFCLDEGQASTPPRFFPGQQKNGGNDLPQAVSQSQSPFKKLSK